MKNNMENNIKVQIKNIVDSFVSHDTNKGNVIILDECWDPVGAHIQQIRYQH